jgi:ribosomal protein S27AE
MARSYNHFASQVKELLMDKKTFETIDPILDEIAEVANELLQSVGAEKLRSLLSKVNKTLGSRYLVDLHLNVTVLDTEKERCLPVLQSGLSGFDRDKPYLASGDSTPQRYIVDGEMVIVPHDRCPRCWEDWDFKFQNPSCSHCGISLGKEVKLLLDTDVCPNCEEGKVSVSHPRCKKCGYEVDLSQVAWG